LKKLHTNQTENLKKVIILGVGNFYIGNHKS